MKDKDGLLVTLLSRQQKYPVSFTVMDAWTPAGQLYYVLTADNITINGNVYQDWHIAPGFGSG